MADRPSYTTFFLLIASVFLIDQISKTLAIYVLRPQNTISLAGEWLRLTYVENSGMSFGLLIPQPGLFWILSLSSLVLLLYYAWRLRESLATRIAFAVLIGGALGNLCDRLFRGVVIDFFDIDFIDISFRGGSLLFWKLPPFLFTRLPVFNLADAAIALGLFLVLFASPVSQKTKTTLLRYYGNS